MDDGEVVTPAVRRRVLAVLCLTQLTGWGVLYYAFPVLAPALARDTGWSISSATAAFSAGLLVSAAVGVPVGRWLDRDGPRWVMSAGSVVGVAAVAGLAAAPSWGWFLAAWLVAGVAQAAVLYPPAFTALTRWWAADRVRALTAVTVAGGLASTVFAPLTAGLLGPLGWRGTYLVLAAVLAVVTVPAHLFGLRAPWPAAPRPGEEPPAHGDGAGDPDHRDPERVARSRPFVLLCATIFLGAFCSFAVIVNQVPLLVERGFSTGFAAWALGLGGVGQVVGRLGWSWLARRLGVRGRAALVLGLLAVTSVVLAVLPGPAALLVVVAMVAGAARGTFTLLQATALSDRWPSRFYGRLAGLLSAPVMVAVALSPWLGSVLAGVVGYPPLFALLGVLGVVGAVLATGTGVDHSGHDHSVQDHSGQDHSCSGRSGTDSP